MTLHQKTKFPQFDKSSAYEIHTFEESLTPSSVATIVTVEQAFVVTGILANDILLSVEPQVAINVGIAGERITAVDEVTVAFVNPTAGSLTPTAGLYQFTVLRKAS